KEVVRALKELRQQGAKGLILDLRDNEGGYKAQAVGVASQFLKEGQVVFLQEDAKGHREEVKVEEAGDAPDLPLVVLVNGRTASSAEILAGALQDNGRAKVVGTRTIGTGTVLREFPLSAGRGALLPAYKGLPPGGRTIGRRARAPKGGIDPDKGLQAALPASASPLPVDPDHKLTEEELAASRDLPLLKAL